MKPPDFVTDGDEYHVTVTTVACHRDVVVADLYLSPGPERAKIGDVSAGSYGGLDVVGATVTLWVDDPDPVENQHAGFVSIRLAGSWDSIVSRISDNEARAVFVRRK